MSHHEIGNRLDFQINLLAEQENTEQLRLLRLLCAKNGIPLDATTTRDLAEQTRPEEIIRQLEEIKRSADGQS